MSDKPRPLEIIAIFLAGVVATLATIIIAAALG